MGLRARCRPSRLSAVLLGVALCVSLCGCAWSNRANRPVWNAFEEHLVPADDTAFYATLPLTIPAGLLSALLDTFIVHPAQVADDAWGDAMELWRNMHWETQYYTALASLPFRAVGTPIVFVVQFLARSAFDIPPRGATAAEGDPDAAPTPSPEQAREQQLLEQLQHIAAGDAGEWFPDADQKTPAAWTSALQSACDAALAQGNAYGRLQLYGFLREHRLKPWLRDPLRALRDPEPVVRFRELDLLPANVEVPEELRRQLRDDSDEAVRLLAHSRLP